MQAVVYGMIIGSASYHSRDDSFKYNADEGLFLVADGVTRDRNKVGEYPNPSPALRAAETFCSVAASVLDAPEGKALIIKSEQFDVPLL